MKRMKIINSCLILFLTGCLMTACDQLEDELFTKKVIFTNNGFVEYPLYLTESGDETIHLSVSVSGTSSNSSEVQVKYQLNENALNEYNYNKYRDLVGSYYKLLPADCYTFINNDVVIESGQEYGLLPIRFHFDKINKYERYVLPISLTETSVYETDSIHSKVLLNINLLNEFSGAYAMANSFLYIDRDTLPVSGSSRSFYAVDHNTCYFYAGNISDLSFNFEKHAIEVSLNPVDSTLSFRAIYSELNLTFPAADKDEKINTFSVAESKYEGSKDPITTTQLNFEYTYDDLTLGVEVPITKRFKGSLINQR